MKSILGLGDVSLVRDLTYPCSHQDWVHRNRSCLRNNIPEVLIQLRRVADRGEAVDVRHTLDELLLPVVIGVCNSGL